MVSKLRKLFSGSWRWPIAMVVAAGSDAVSFSTALIPPLQVALDFVTAFLLWFVLGWRWPLLVALIIEAIPGLGAFPTWVVAVGALMTVDDHVPKLATGHQAKKIVSRVELIDIMTRLRAEGKKAVFTNGVFDLLHVGHLRYLTQARSLGDALVVGLNADACVKRLKGDKRPILPQAERAELLAGLACVDYVCIFEEDDPRELIRAATPSLLVKGGDWPVEAILGRDTVEAAGGRVMSLPFIAGQSTTGIVKSIVERYRDDFKE